jgi:hypothetical protein
MSFLICGTAIAVTPQAPAATTPAIAARRPIADDLLVCIVFTGFSVPILHAPFKPVSQHIQRIQQIGILLVAMKGDEAILMPACAVARIPC